MNKRQSFNIGSLICLVAAIYIIYYLLLRDSILPFSIHSVVTGINHWTKNWHIVVIGFLPIYLALMIFGTAMLGVYLGSALQRWVGYFWKHKR